MGRDTGDHINWRKLGNETFEAGPHKQDDFTALIEWTGAGYELTITGPGAPAPTMYPTRKRAKHAYQEFLHEQP